MKNPEQLQHSIRTMRERRNAPKRHTPRQSAYGQVIRYGVEMLSALLVGVLLGYHADQWLGTSPLLLLLCTCCGSAAGFLTIKRVHDAQAEEMEKTAGESD